MNHIRTFRRPRGSRSSGTRVLRIRIAGTEPADLERALIRLGALLHFRSGRSLVQQVLHVITRQ